MSSESADRELALRLIALLFVCIPLVVFLASSLGLIALKRLSRLPPWAARLAAPPFYLVSLPIATVTAGLQLFIWISAGLYLFFRHWLSWPDVFIELWIIFAGLHVETLLPGMSFVWVFVSASLLWRTVWKEDGRGSISKKAQQRRRALLLLLAFMWAWGSIGYLVYVYVVARL
ncbi:hypothetical protein [Bradyrhizobium sp.]|uniref:hypothetical protein n=1 Tax=Bradyrhizobium sp. TaxID=376 RepID=UPI0025B90F2A|nr:hypothetical protein [Bradyrhizobium sp.]MBV8918388.1 hypothetical protein [Bradyrhizobium sp.]